MIPVILPFAIFIVLFAALLGLALLTLAGSHSFLESVKAWLSTSFEEPDTFGTAELPSITPVFNKDMPRVEGYALPQALFYHRGHTWVSPHDSETAVVGIDEFLSKLMGTATLVNNPREGQYIRQGEKGWTVCRGGKYLDIVSPLEGEVVAVNRRLAENPEMLSKDPYGEGWLMMIKPKSFSRDLRDLLHGSAAGRWMEESAAELRAFFSSKLGLVFQDGGLPLDGLADHLEPEDWNRLVARIFGSESKTSGN
jgi:glycine cleavage system H lipoate-binding protein